jgi:antitoxin component of MazEF toxin-antitoxin module
MELKIQRIGNSAGFVVPKAILQHLGLDVGSVVDVELADGQLIIRPKPKLTLDEMLATCTPENTALTDEDREWLSDDPVGKEIL